MSDGTAEIRKLSENIGKVSGSALKDVDAVVQKGALNVKEELNYSALWSEHFKGMAGSVTYDSHYLPGRVRYDVGPDKSRRGGGIGNVAYFGTSRGGGTLDIEQPLRAEGPRLQSALADLAKKWAGKL